MLWRAAGVSEGPAEWYERLTKAYAEPHRHYHTQQHIAECLTEFDEARHLASHAAAVELALWFHDAVYDPKASDNEEQSAALLKSCAAEGRMPESVAELAARLAMATKHHEVDLDSDAALMVDVDLSILGQSEERFSEYERQIRKEYRWVPRPIFGPRRAEILERFLARPSIFATEWFRTKYEEHARHNLKASIVNLRRFRLIG